MSNQIIVNADIIGSSPSRTCRLRVEPRGRMVPMISKKETYPNLWFVPECGSVESECPHGCTGLGGDLVDGDAQARGATELSESEIGLGAVRRSAAV